MGVSTMINDHTIKREKRKKKRNKEEEQARKENRGGRGRVICSRTDGKANQG
jgi:hypothetical protein